MKTAKYSCLVGKEGVCPVCGTPGGELTRLPDRRRKPILLHRKCRARLDMLVRIQAEVKRQVPRFRILRGWSVIVDPDFYYQDRMCTDVDRKQARIYSWSGRPRGVRAYVKHELLHLCLRALRQVRAADRHETEEMLVQGPVRATLSWSCTPRRGR